MNSGLLFLLFCGIISEHLGFGQNGQKSAKVSKKLNLKVHINATGDTLVMKFLRPSQNTKLEGFILGYGSSFFSNQYIQWPENGKSFVTEVDAEPRYLISIKPNENHKKSCKEKNSTPKPLQLVIGTLTPTSVFLSWGILINPQIDWSVLNKCPNDRFYTVRYREKNKDWLFQLCPTTEVVIDNLKPNTMYEFGVKDNTDGGIWSNLYNHKTLPKGKENGQSYNVYKIPKGVIQLSPENTKAFIPITVYKQGFQNISNLIKPKTTAAAPPTEQIVLKEEPIKPSTTTKSPTPKPKPVIKVTEPPPAPKTEKPDTEDLNPAVTGQPFVESIPLDSSTDTLEWVRATMATHPYIPVPNASPEPPTIDDQSKASTLASPIFAPAPLTRGPLQQPETVMAESGSLTTQALEAGSISQIVSVRPLSAINPPGTTTALPIMQQTTLGKSSTVISVTLRPEVPTEGILPASSDAAALVTRVPHKKTTFGIKTRIITSTLGHTSSIPVKHPSTTDKPQTSTHATIKPKRPKLERRLSQTTSSSAPLVPSKTTLETRKKARTPKGIHPKSTDASPITMHVPIKPQTTMLAVREKDSVYAHTTKPSLEHPQTLHATSGKSLTYVATRKSISEPPQTMHVSRGKHPTYVPTEKSSMEHPITPDGLSLIQPSSPTALDATSKITLITQKQERTAEAGRYQLSTDEQQTSPYIHVKHQQTTMAGGHPMSTYKPQVSTDLPVKMHRTTMAPSGKHPKYLTTTKPSMEHPHTAHDEPIIAPPSTSTPELTMEIPPVTLQQAPSIEATTRQSIPDKYSTLPPQSLPKPTTVFTGGHFFPTTTQDIPKTEGPLIIPVSVSTETPLFHPKAIPSTEAPQYADDSTQPAAEITSTDVPYTSKQEEIILDSSDKTFVHTFATTAKPDAEMTAASQETPKLHSTKTPSIPKQSTLAPKRSHLHLIQSSMSPTIEAKSPTPVLKTTEAISLTEEHAETLASTIKTSSPAPNALIPTESPLPNLDRKTPHRMPINLIRVHFFEDSDQSTVPGITGKTRITTDNPLPKDDLKTPQRMPINLIRVHFHDDTEQTTVPNKAETDFPPKFRKTTESPLPKHAASESQTTSSPTPKPTKSSKKSLSEPVVKSTQTPPQPKTTQRPESPHTKPVPIPTQKVSPPKTKKPQTPRPRAKSAPTRPPQVSNKPIVTHQIREATLAPYRVHPSSSRPRASVRPRARPVQNGTVRARPTGDVMTAPIPGGRLIDHTKLLGVSRNISVELNNTGKRPPSVSSAPILPIRPTSMRRRFPPTNVTGRPGGPGSILVPRAPSTPKPNRTTMPIKTPTKQPTYPSPEDNTVETTVFSPSPKSDIDALGKTRYTAPHVKYMSKDDKIPCSITESLRHFPHEEANNNEDITNPPQNPPSNLTVVTVEGCPSFVILDWDPSDNDTVTEYEVISKENGGPPGKDQSIITTNQTHSTVENLKPDTSYEFHVIPKNPLGEGPVSNTVEFNTESADPRVSEPVKAGKDAIWTEIKFKPDSYSECKGKMYVKRTWYKKFVGIQLCNSLRYKIYLSDSLTGTFYNIGDQSGFGEDHCQFVDSFLDGRTGQQLLPDQLARRKGFYRSVRQQPVDFGEIGGNTHISYVHWYECGIAIPGKW